MAAPEKLTTTMSSKGQVILPSPLRKRYAWGAGTRLTVEEIEDCILLKPAPAFAETRPEDAFGILPHMGKPKTLEEMDTSILAEATLRHAGD